METKALSFDERNSLWSNAIIDIVQKYLATAVETLREGERKFGVDWLRNPSQKRSKQS